MAQDNRLLPLSPAAGPVDRPLRELTQTVPVTGSYSSVEPTHLREYLNVVLKRKWLILSLVTVVTTLVAIQMYRLPSIYEAVTIIKIEQKSKTLFRSKDVVFNAGSDPQYWNTQLKLLENPELHREVITKMGLQNNPAFLGGQARPSLLATLRRALSRDKTKTGAPAPADDDGGLPVADVTAPSQRPALTPEQVAALEPYENALRDNLTVDPVERTNLVEIHFRHNDPAIARLVSDALAQAFIERDLNSETEGTVRAKETTAKQITDLQNQIEKFDQERVAYMRAHNIPINNDLKGLNVPGIQVEGLATESLVAQNKLKEAQAEYDAAQRAQAGHDIYSIPAVEENEQVQKLRLKVAELEEKRAALLQQYTAEWPEVKKVEAQIKQTREAQDKAANAVVVALGAKLDAAKSRAASLQSDYGRARASATSQGIDGLYLNNLNQQLETSKQMLSVALQRRTELETAAAGEGPSSSVSVQTKARTPRLVGPPRVRNIMIALLLALGAGVGLAFLLDYLDDTLKSIEDVDRHVHLPTLALIPAPREARRLAFGRTAHAPAPAEHSTALALIEQVRSPVAEAYRHLRTSLLLSSAGQPPRTILVTSSQPSEGKTTTAVNTAMMLAQTGADVLVLDCDLRRPRIHSHFQLPNTRGVTNYLSGEASLVELIQTYERQPNLKVITSGPVPPNAAELLGSEEMRRLLHALSENFTHVIIDSPPAISFTDASILSTMVDGVMLVVHGGRSSRAVVRRAKQQLLDVGAHIFGIVLNNVRPESNNDYYYNYGYYSSYYAQDDEAEAGAAEAGAADGRSA
ncbi:MAG TPA: polysaccharide biosynthesis tyrosine autokinase [Pyrinomonadaceae bacterium]|jgi:capsular exopolysaccharide synthesis family protein